MDITVKKSVIYWHDAKLLPPAKDGTYIIKWWDEIDIMRYTTDGGWNTSRSEDGSIFKPENEVHSVALWSEMPEIYEVKI